MLVKILLFVCAAAAFGCGTVNTSVTNNSDTRIAEATPVTDATPVIDATPKPAPPSDIPFDKDTVITIKRGACYGRCPQYSMSIKANGDVEFEGIKDTTVNGKTSGTIAPDEVKGLIAEFEKIGFFELDDQYNEQNCPNSATDQSTVIISLTAGGKTKTISHYTGCVEDDPEHTPYPAGLLALENKIHEIPQEKKWSGQR